MTSESACVICGRPVPGWEPKMCCSGWECACMGRPINPCTCSAACDRAVYEHIGWPMAERGRLAGIERWEPTDKAGVK